MSQWAVFYDKAIRDDGSLMFPERLTHEFLFEQKKRLGSYVFANQYQNQIIPLEDRVLKPEWLRYYLELPEKKTTFAFIDPAISKADTADYTGIVVIECDVNKTWYLKYAHRHRLNPTEIVDFVFKLQEEHGCHGIGIEDIAYQKALLYMVHEESMRRNKHPPVRGINAGTGQSKEIRIQGLVPRFEWGRILLKQGMSDFEKEYLEFPRGSHDDLLDALSQLEQMVYYPEKERKSDEPPAANHPDYERWYRQNLYKTRSADESAEY